MKDLKSALMMLFVFTVLLGGVYPAVVTGLARVFFPSQAAGSFITDQNGRVVGSALIGQPFSDPKYFWPRPSATANFGYNPLASGGANLGPTNPAFLRRVGERVGTLRAAGLDGPIPADLVLASGSGLDPHITPEAALAQIPRVAKAHRMTEGELGKMVATHTENRQWDVLGQPRVNVLALNLALDKLTP